MSRYGLVGKDISYSYSKKIHEKIGETLSLRISYDILDSKDLLEVSSHVNQLRNGYYKGLNVTIPYKESIIDFCDELTEHARKINAVNTLYMKEGKLIGDNTDYIGFKAILDYYHINLKNQVVYVLGSGGASKAVCYALNQVGAKSVIISRNEHPSTNQLTKSYAFLDKLEKIHCIVNTTPVGTTPNVNQMPVSNSVASKTNIVIDLIYNPRETLLMKMVNFGINGSIMLIGQALKAQILWNDLKIPEPNVLYERLLEVIE